MLPVSFLVRCTYELITRIWNMKGRSGEGRKEFIVGNGSEREVNESIRKIKGKKGEKVRGENHGGKGRRGGSVG